MTLDRDNRVDYLLRTLDPATADPDTGAHERAHALLESIVATPPTAQPRRSAVRWFAVAAAAAAFTVAAATLPSLWPTSPAYGTWTAEPIPVTGATRDQAVAACREAMADFGREWTGPHRPTPMAETARTAIAEQRGEVLLVSLVTDNDSGLTCMFDAHRPSQMHGAHGSSATADTPTQAPLGPEGLRFFGPGTSTGADGGFADIAGRVGADVRSVTIHANGVAVEASVNDGIFAAWWPIPGSFEDPMIMDIRFDVTLTDGRTLTDVPGGT